MNGKCYQHSSLRAWQKSATQWTVSPHVNSTLTGCRKQIKIKYYVEFITQLNGIGQWTTKDDDRIEIVIIRKMKLKENVSFSPYESMAQWQRKNISNLCHNFEGKVVQKGKHIKSYSCCCCRVCHESCQKYYGLKYPKYSLKFVACPRRSVTSIVCYITWSESSLFRQFSFNL